MNLIEKYRMKKGSPATAMPEMKSLYADLLTWLGEQDLTADDIKRLDMTLYDSMQLEIEAMDSAMRLQDLEGFKLHTQEVKRLYLKAIEQINKGH